MPYITAVFLPICNSENGDLISLPFEGGVMQQPYMTMQIIGHIQNQYRKIQSQKVQKIRGGSPGGSSSARRPRPRRGRP